MALGSEALPADRATSACVPRAAAPPPPQAGPQELQVTHLAQGHVETKKSQVRLGSWEGA